MRQLISFTLVTYDCPENIFFPKDQERPSNLFHIKIFTLLQENNLLTIEFATNFHIDYGIFLGEKKCMYATGIVILLHNMPSMPIEFAQFLRGGREEQLYNYIWMFNPADQ